MGRRYVANVVQHPQQEVSEEPKRGRLDEEERKMLRKKTVQFGAFKKNREGVDDTVGDPIKEFYLEGTWKDGTLKSYNSGMAKYVRFGVVHGLRRSDILPATKVTIMRFIIWASHKVDHKVEPSSLPKETIKSSTIKNYVYGIKAWHEMHNEPYPDVDKQVELLLRTTKKRERDMKMKKKEKDPVLLPHLKVMMETLSGGGKKEQAAFLVALVAFWGLARLGELISDNPKKSVPRGCDVERDESGLKTTITLWDAKGARNGEPQWLVLRRQNSKLDPLDHLDKWIKREGIQGATKLFSWKEGSGRHVLTKAEFGEVVDPIWGKIQHRKLTGHSMRVGGASLLWNLGVRLPIVIESGRWRSNSYDVYLKKYSADERKEAKRILKILRK